MKDQSLFFSTPFAIVLGALMISVSILLVGGVIKVGKPTSAVPGVQTQAQVPVLPQPTVPPVPAQATLTIDDIKDVFTKSQIKFGDASSKLVIVEVADPSCPYCHVAGGRNADLNKQMGSRFTLVADGGSYIAPVPEIEKLVKAGKAAFSYVYYPGHGSGEMGTKALYCANDAGKFWEVHDIIMSDKGYTLMNDEVKNDKTKSQDLANYLQSVFDPVLMKNCLDSGKYDKRLQEDMALASKLNPNGTPGFYLNAKQYAGAYSYTDMESTVNSALGI